MAATRSNRFDRPSRSFHSPPSSNGVSKSRDHDIELGAVLAKRPLSWTYQSSGRNSTDSASDKKHRRTRRQSPSFLNIASMSASVLGMGKGNANVPALRATSSRSFRPRSRTFSRLAFVVKTFLMTLGLLQCITSFYNMVEAIFPEELDLISGPFKDHFASTSPQWAVSEDGQDRLTVDVHPFMCHSHNDYWRREPLFQAIKAGCTGVEADVFSFNDRLYVAHTASGIRPNRTLESLYLEPLMQILDQKNSRPDFLGADNFVSSSPVGVFETKPKQSLVLLIDFKNKPEEIWPQIHSSLKPFRDKNYLTYFSRELEGVVHGPLTVVLSGRRAPFHHILENSTYRDVFYDAPLGNLTSLPHPYSDAYTNTTEQPDTDYALGQQPQHPTIYSPLNSYYASTSFVHSIGYPFHSSLTQSQLNMIRSQIRLAHAAGLKVRYWGIPAWPIGVRNYLWRVLVREGVDYLSVDDIEDVNLKDWGPRKGGWGKKWWR